jgi:hypothetical protein
MPRLDFCEIAPAAGESADLDQFEKFAAVFFEKVLAGKVTQGPTRGADGGIDLKVEFVENGVTVKKLVSCKHTAHSKTSVGIGDEQDVVDRVRGWDCTVFVGFYSFSATSALEAKLRRLQDNEKISFEIFSSEHIETHLLDSHKGFMVAKRFFPRSIQNIWPQVISLAQAYTDADVEGSEGRWIVRAAFNEHGPLPWANSREAALRLANERATTDIHAPMFLSAWKDAARMFPAFFCAPEGIDNASAVAELPPNWGAEQMLGDLSPNRRWSLLAIWSMVDERRVREIMKRMHKDPSQISQNLLGFAWLAEATGTERRDVLTRLFAYR